MVEFERINVHYGKNHVLKELSVKVAAGEVVSLIGANAAGKTTSLRTAMGLKQATSGTLAFGNQLQTAQEINLQGVDLNGSQTPTTVVSLVSPVEFIPLAEKTGLIHRIGRWVLYQAVADWAELRPCCASDAHHSPFVSINLSAPELAG